MDSTYNRLLYLVVSVTLILSLCLIVVGSFISGAGYGLAIPDWPLSQGQLIPDSLAGGALYEFIHRMGAALVGALTICLGVYAWTRPTQPLARRFALLAAVLIVAQILLGGVGVLSLFPSSLRTLHAALAHLLIAALTVVATVASQGWISGTASLGGFDEKTAKKTKGLAGMVLAQVLVGSILRHASLGSVYAGALVLHLLIAIGVVASALSTANIIGRQGKGGPVVASAYAAAALAVFQLVLGGLVVVTAPGVRPAVGQRSLAYVAESSTHVTIGALLIVLSLYVALMVTRRAHFTSEG